MPLTTDLSISPYFDDYDRTKDYYRQLFKPSLPVQTRELNQLQTLLQAQIEKFGDQVFRAGTIVDGCNFIFYNNYPYAKILDNEVAGRIAIPSLYVGLFVKNSANLQAHVVNYFDGFEATDPNLKTIYLHYTNASDDGQTYEYSPGDTLTVFDSNNSIFNVNINNGGMNFSNSDVVVFCPALALQVSSGSFAPGDYLIEPGTGANVVIKTVDTTTLAANGQVLVTVAPRPVDLANAAATFAAWTIDELADVINQTATAVGVVERVYGQSAQAQIVTNGVGKVTNFIMTSQGLDFLYPPTVSIQSPGNSLGIAALDVVAQNYMGQIKVASGLDAIGNGYAFGVTEGTTYQKGYFLRVAPQMIIVDKYSNSPNNVAVGFSTVEEIVDYNQDPSLLDNALGTKNENGPGADRLRLTPVLNVQSFSDASSNDNFFNLVEWSEGQPYKQQQVSQYSRIGDEMAQRTYDNSGNFVIDTFQVTSVSNANTDLEGTLYTCAVDPGQAYINGYRVQTLRNFYIDVMKGLNTRVANNIVSLNYGNYIRINEMGGLFQFSTGDVVKLYDTPTKFLSNNDSASTANVAPKGTQIGTARIRSLVHENGVQGDANCVNRLYLFNVTMNSGQNFRNVRCIAYGANVGIADVILDADPTTQTNVAIIQRPGDYSLIFDAGCESLKNSNGTVYDYRTIDQTTAFANSGQMVKSIASHPNEFYPYFGTLTDAQLADLIVVPIGGDLVQYATMEGHVNVSTGNTAVQGDACTNFFSSFAPGDWINITANAAANMVAQVAYVTGGSGLVLKKAPGFTNNNCTYRRIFPKNIPIPFGSRKGLGANVNPDGNILTLTLAHANGSALSLAGTTSVTTALAVNIERRNITSTTKTATRNRFVKLNLSSNPGGAQGPWCLGVSDVFRLRHVYLGDSTVNTNSSDITVKFLIDNNQTSNYLDLSWLLIDPRSGFKLPAAGAYLLVEFDYYVRTADGYFDTVSYLGTANAEQIAALDSTPLDELTSTAVSWEVPECYGADGKYYDLLKQFDFRPDVEATCAPTTDPATAPLDPASTLSFGTTSDPDNDKKFPVPDSLFRTVQEQYLGRVDSVFIGGDKGNIYVLKGISDADPRRRLAANQPKGSLKLQTLSVPPYPNLTQHLSEMVTEHVTTRIINERSLNLRASVHTVTPLLSAYEFQLSQPMVYTMEDISNLERRIKDLEYYQSLSALQTSLANKIIPSSVDRTITRFKYGFFADDFSTFNFADLTNPQYSASFETEGGEPFGASKNPLDTGNWANSDVSSPDSSMLSPTKLLQRSTNRVVPPKFVWTVPMTLLNAGYIDEGVVSQNNATITTPADNCVPQVISNTVTTPGSNAYFWHMEQGLSVGQSDTQTLTMGPVAGPVTLWLYDYTFGKIDVIKNGTVVASTNNAANMVVPLSANDKVWLVNNSNAKPWYNADGATDLNKAAVRWSGHLDYVQYAGKIQFMHNPATGRAYQIRVTRGN